MRISLNLATRTYVDKRRINRLYLLFVFLLGGGFFYGLTQFAVEQRTISNLSARLEAVRSDRRSMEIDPELQIRPGELEALRTALPFANALLVADSFRWTELLDRLERVVPEGVAIRSLQPDHDRGTVSITGVALSVGDLREFLDNLAAVPGLDEAYLLNQSRVNETQAGDESVTLVQFSLRIQGVFKS